VTPQVELVERAKRGDRDAFDALATEAVGPMFAVARLFLGSTEPAQDAVQEAMLEAWRDLPGLRHPERFNAWLRRLVIHRCYRQRVRAVPAIAMTDAAHVSLDEAAGIADRDAIERGFRRLPADQRAALVLRFYLDLSVSDIAEALHVPEGTAKSRIHRGLSTMRANLEADARPGHGFTEGSIV
jgi:RNA polymerase sigma-70 factor (ECF subfamily)